ncbi:MAG TPA: hypothetical protein H9698_05865 [Candidatus Ruthenibacterium merdavium]|uniref:Uncharacterized protein n=1 Tax=Candidatus Ruthenibacterium merdavium TaxID=2838752 RepID=A0A9D2Q6C2_9FIRM|nr:hypothetical protein [Candidatus Ruthenibacterium merdavium]
MREEKISRIRFDQILANQASPFKRKTMKNSSLKKENRRSKRISNSASCCPIFNQEKQGQNSSNPARTRQTGTEDVKQKNPEKPQFFGVFELF